jgi:hypothetical protein
MVILGAKDLLGAKLQPLELDWLLRFAQFTLNAKNHGKLRFQMNIRGLEFKSFLDNVEDLQSTPRK